MKWNGSQDPSYARTRGSSTSPGASLSSRSRTTPTPLGCTPSSCSCHSSQSTRAGENGSLPGYNENISLPDSWMHCLIARCSGLMQHTLLIPDAVHLILCRFLMNFCNWIAGTFLFLTGPIIADWISPNKHEAGSIWCFHSIMQIVLMVALLATTQHASGKWYIKPAKDTGAKKIK